MSTTSINTSIASLLAAVSDVLTTNVPLVLAIVGGLIAAGLIVRLVKRHIGRKL